MKRDDHEKFDIYDIMMIAGLIILGVGLWWYHPPLAMSAVGTILLVLGIILDIQQAKRKSQE